MYESSCERIVELMTHPTNEIASVNRHSFRLGRIGGLKLVLNPQLQQYLVNVTSNNFLEEGFLVSVGYVYEPVLSNPVVLQPNTHTWISLSSTQTVMKKSLYPIYNLDCRKNTELNVLNGLQFINCFGTM